MINQTNAQLGRVRSAIRELFEYGKKRKAEIGEENVYDFSLGNPSVPAPESVKRELINLIQNTDPVALHGYTSAQGDYCVRKSIADGLNARYSLGLNADCLYMTCGAAASLCITLNALLNEGDEVITFAPFFPEYAVFVNHAGGKLIALSCDKETFQPDVNALKSALTPKTKAVIINSPNNPSGVVYSAKIIEDLAAILTEYEGATGNGIYLISDEPYRELVFEKTMQAPSVLACYKRSVLCYSYSKSLSLPGERIGYIAVNNTMQNFDEVYAAVCGAGRALGYVCAPALFQQLVARVGDATADVSVYKRNRDLLYGALTELGFEVVKPDGAFYLFVKSPDVSAQEFADKAREFELLIVPSDSFGVEGYARISYCVSTDMIERSLPAFGKLASCYKLR